MLDGLAAGGEVRGKMTVATSVGVVVLYPGVDLGRSRGSGVWVGGDRLVDEGGGRRRGR